MARNRQRAKERQARRRAQQGDGERPQRRAPVPGDPEPPAGPDATGGPPSSQPEAALPDRPTAPPPASVRGNGREEGRDRATQERRDEAAQEERRDQAELEGRRDEAQQEPRDEAAEEELRERVELEVGAPPHNLGRSDEVLEEEPELDEEHFDPAEDIPQEDLVAATGPTGHRGPDAGQHKDRPRFVQFLFAVRAELARVQWPDRQALTTLTGVVLGFVLIAGGYLGLLDAIFSRLIQAIL